MTESKADGKHFTPLQKGDEQKTLPCSVCGKKLKLLGYGEKWAEGKRKSRWPTWEKCDKKLHKKKDHVIKTATDEELFKKKTPKKNKKVSDDHKGPPAYRYQKISGEITEFFINTCARKFEEKTGNKPTKGAVHPDDFPTIEKTKFPFPMEQDAKLSPGMNYLDLYI